MPLPRVEPLTRSTAAATAAFGLAKTPSTEPPPRSTSKPPCSPSAATTVSSCLVSCAGVAVPLTRRLLRNVTVPAGSSLRGAT